MELVENYSDGKIHKSEPELRNGGNVNTVYFSSYKLAFMLEH